MEKQAKTLDGQIEKASRNLALLDPENIPAVQDELRRLRTERDTLTEELRKRPPTEQDINAETLDVLQSLEFMAMFFRTAAQPDFRPGYLFWPMVTQECGEMLRKIAGITVDTRVGGKGTRVRHVFQAGKVEFRPVGGSTGQVNPHLPL
jgi:hypothetical protein